MGKKQSKKAPKHQSRPAPSRKRAQDMLDDDEIEDIELPKPKRRAQAYEARPANPGGVYLPDHEQLVRLIAARGMADEEIELIYGLGKGTLANWKKAYPSLQRAIEEGRTVADANVLFALYKTATGYDYEEDQAVGGREPEVLRVRKHKPGEFAAQKHWLGNRIRRQDGSTEWPRSEQIELGGHSPGNGIKTESRNDLIDAIIGLVTSKPDKERTRTPNEESGRK